jgi:hypothetical protein
MYKIFIGWDSREKRAYEVCKYSITSRTNQNIIIKPLKQKKLRSKKIYYRPNDELASTEFSLTRFLVPHISKYKGFSIFMDCDFLIKDDIDKIFNLIDKTKAVSVVKHDYNPSNTVKMDNKKQHLYPRKNWSSFIVFNNEHPSNKKLNLDVVNNESPQYLHRFSWLEDHEIGEISHEWNYLVGWYNDIKNPKGIHYTEGGPWFKEYVDCEFSKDWLHEYFLMNENGK